MKTDFKHKTKHATVLDAARYYLMNSDAIIAERICNWITEMDIIDRYAFECALHLAELVEGRADFSRVAVVECAIKRTMFEMTLGYSNRMKAYFAARPPL